MSDAGSSREPQRAGLLEAGQKKALELAVGGAPLAAVLEILARTAAQAHEGARAAIFTVDPQHARLRFAAAAGIPTAYTRSIEGFEIGPRSPSCGKAAYTGRTVIVADITQDPLWADHLDIAQRHGIRACWSQPIRTSSGTVLGTIALYHRHPRAPGPHELDAVRFLGHTAALIIERHRESEERRRTEEVLRQRTMQFETLLNEAPLGVFLIDADFRILHVNPRVQPALGAIPDLIGRDLGEVAHAIWPQAYADEIVQRFHHTLETGEPHASSGRGEERLDRGVVEHYEWQINRIPLPCGRHGVVCYFRDISEQVRVNMAIAESEERFRQMANSIDQLAWIARPDGYIYWYNDRWYEYTGTTPGQMEGWGWQSVHDPASLPEVLERWRSALSSGAPLDATFPLRGADGVFRPFLTRSVPLRDSEGRIVQWFGTNTDVSGIRRLTEEREQLLEAERAARVGSESANRLKDEFLATLSHELRTPLSVIVSWSRVLLRKHAGENEDLRKGLKLIVDNAMAQSQMIGDLLDMSRIVSGKTALELKPLDLSEFVTQYLASHQPGAQEKGIELTLGQLGPPKIVLADPARLQQVIGNLLTNALKFTPRGGRVEVSVRPAGRGFEIEVRDTGEGIAPEFLPHLFDRFRQADGSSTRRHGGLGLGLALVRQIVEMHGGRVEAASEGLGRGACFTVWLPAAPTIETTEALEHTGSWELDSQELETGELKGLRVLAVEDEPAMLEFLLRVLEEHGAEVIAARSGEEAANVLRAGAARGDLPQVLVCDIGMPGMDGYALVRTVRGEQAISAERLPAIAVTAFAREEDRRRALEAGFQIHLSKPYGVAQLVASIRQLCGRGAASLT